MKRYTTDFALAAAILFGVIAVICALCSCATPRPQLPVERVLGPSPRIWSWPERSFPVRVWASSDLHPCELAATWAAMAWWESYAHRKLFLPTVVKADSPMLRAPQAHGITVHRLVGVDPLTRGLATPVFLSGRRLLYGVDIGLDTCSVRDTAHEFGHALGLGHSPDRMSVMWHWSDPAAIWLDMRDLEEAKTGAR